MQPAKLRTAEFPPVSSHASETLLLWGEEGLAQGGIGSIYAFRED